MIVRSRRTVPIEVSRLRVRVVLRGYLVLRIRLHLVCVPLRARSLVPISCRRGPFEACELFHPC